MFTRQKIEQILWRLKAIDQTTHAEGFWKEFYRTRETLPFTIEFGNNYFRILIGEQYYCGAEYYVGLTFIPSSGYMRLRKVPGCSERAQILDRAGAEILYKEIMALRPMPESQPHAM